jgi:hypothetical protein
MSLDLHMQFMVTELMNQGEMALLAWDQVQAALATTSDPQKGARVWAGLQAFATCQGIMSNVLFIDKRGQELRARFHAITQIDFTPLADHEMRNHFTHFEERLRDYVEISNVRGAAIQDRAFSADIGMEPPPDQLRRFNPKTSTVTIRTRKSQTTADYPLVPMVACIRAVTINAEFVRWPQVLEHYEKQRKAKEAEGQ